MHIRPEFVCEYLRLLLSLCLAIYICNLFHNLLATSAILWSSTKPETVRYTQLVCLKLEDCRSA